MSDLIDLRTVISDYRPGHAQPVHLRIVIAYGTDAVTGEPYSLLRIHGTGLGVLLAVGTLIKDGVHNLALVHVDPCSEQFHCTHSYWRGPADLTQDQILVALTALTGINGAIPYAEPLPQSGE